jgi:hypothetical protein
MAGLRRVSVYGPDGNVVKQLIEPDQIADEVAEHEQAILALELPSPAEYQRLSVEKQAAANLAVLEFAWRHRKLEELRFLDREA